MNPFISFTNVQGNPARCSKIVDASALESDIASGVLPDYSLYIPDLNNDGHDTGPAFADQWFSKAFGQRLGDARFMKDLVVVATFDESEKLEPTNHIYTAVVGSGVVAGTLDDGRYGHYSLLRTIEDTLGLGNLAQGDLAATPISNIWK